LLAIEVEHVGLSFRPAREDDLERLVDIHTAAFPDARGREQRARKLASNPLGDLGDLWVGVAHDSGAVVAHGFLFSLRAWFGGAAVHVGGIASVGVAPEARGRRVGSALVEHLHSTSTARGDALTVLYPFRQSFYARLGYATTSAYRRVTLAPDAIPYRADLRARPAIGADRAAMQACWEATGVRRTGTLARPEGLWNARLSDERRTFLVVEGVAGAVEGYVGWTLTQEQEDLPGATTLVVDEMAAATAAAARSLWGLVAAQRGQVTRVCADLAADDPIDRTFVDADRGRPGSEHRVEHSLGEIVVGPMLRLTDARRALAARGYRAEGSVILEVGGDRLRVVARDGRADVEHAGAADPTDLRLDMAGLAAVAYGALPVSHAARLGWVAARDDRAGARAEQLLSLPPYFSPDAF
jgi:predicted acetyltransferase